MSNEPGGEAATIETVVKAAAEAALSSQEPQNGAPDRDYEADAREQGWRPKDEWKGDPAKWKDAETFVADGDRINRIVESKLGKAQKEFDERVSRIEKTSEKAIANLKAAHARELTELTTERKAAIKAADVQEVERIDREIEELKATAPEPASPKLTDKQYDEIVGAWQKDNAWYEKDEDLTLEATVFSQRLLKRSPELSLEDNLARTSEYMREKYPMKVGKPGANGHAPVDKGGSFNGTRPKAGKTAADLPAEAKEMAKLMVKSGAFKDENAYAKEYFNA